MWSGWNRFEYDLRMLRKMAPYAAINYIRHGMGYDDFLKEYAEFRRMKPDELYEIADELQERAAGLPYTFGVACGYCGI